MIKEKDEDKQENRTNKAGYRERGKKEEIHKKKNNKSANKKASLAAR